ncbi:MAG: GTPase HflX [Chloroflexota bacterium]
MPTVTSKRIKDFRNLATTDFKTTPNENNYPTPDLLQEGDSSVEPENSDENLAPKSKRPRLAVHPTTAPRERGLVVGVGRYGDLFEVEDSLNELEQLCDTAGVMVVGRTHQNIDTPNSAYLIGKGKLAELKEMRRDLELDTILFDVELSPTHLRELEAALEVKVIDRTGLILDIFAKRARTHEGRLQVELAQLEYRLPRLTRLWTHLSRQTMGGVGLRGPGETQLEIDRRSSRERISHLKEELKQVHRHRELYRQRRKAEGIPVISLVGYTNSGKSTLLNKLSNAGVLAEDKLFATLDPTTRRIRLPGGREVLLTDTVGFIQRLPTGLVEAFRSTLEEVNEADLLLHVVDFTHPNAQEQSETVEKVLKELEADQRPRLIVLNKIDLLIEKEELPTEEAKPTQSLSERISEQFNLPPEYVPISAQNGLGLDLLLKRIEEALDRDMVKVSLNIPYAQNELVAFFHKKGQVDHEEHSETGTLIQGRIPVQYEQLFKAYH